MRRFVQRAIKKLKKLDPEQLQIFIQDLARENEQLEVVMDSLTDGVMVADIRNNLIFYNKAVERMVPLLGFDVIEQPVWEALSDRDMSSFVRASLINQEAVADHEFAIDAGESPRIINVGIGPLVQSGRITGSIITFRDVSEKRLREAKLRRAESLASLTTLAAGVAHEIKNPLGSIGIHIQLTQRMLSQNTCSYPEEVKGYLNVMNEEVDRLNRIVMDFLFAVRPMDIHPVAASLNQVVNETMQFMQYELEEAGIELKLDLDTELPDLVIDERYIKQAILNVVKNAISAMPKGGTLSVSSGKKDKDAVLKIADTGVGMSQEVLEKIFEPFFTTKDFGSGIGLTLVYKIVKEHGGDINVNSQEGKGTVFKLSFPMPQKERHLLSWDSDSETGDEAAENRARGFEPRFAGASSAGTDVLRPRTSENMRALIAEIDSGRR